MTHPRLQMLALYGLIALALTGCTSDDTFLPALLAEPVASYESPGIVLVDAWEQQQHPGNLWTRRQHAVVERSYQIQDQGLVEQVLREAVAFAEAAGWRIQRESPREYRGAKELDPGTGRIHLSTPAEDVINDPDGPRVLRIHLDFGPVRFHESTTTGPVGG